jgi:hypothetical protein
MTLSDLAALGSFVSGVAVTITLVFLLVQTRQSNRNQRAMMQQGRAAQQVDLLLRCASEDMSAVRLRFLAGDLSMNEREIDTALYTYLAIWRSFEDSFLQHKLGTIGSESFLTDTAIVRFLFTYPSQRATWRLIRARYASDFRDHVNAIMNETKTTQPVLEADLWRQLVKEELAAAGNSAS